MAKLVKIEYNSWNGINQVPSRLLLNYNNVASENPQDGGLIEVTYNNLGYDPSNPVDTFIATTIQAAASTKELQYVEITVYKDDGFQKFSSPQLRSINTDAILRIGSYGMGSIVVYQEYNNNANNFITAYCTETFNSFVDIQQSDGVQSLPTPIPINSILSTDEDGNLVWIPNNVPDLGSHWKIVVQEDESLGFEYDGVPAGFFIPKP